MKSVIIDFETRSKADLKKIGAWNYSLHESTEPLCMAYKIDDEETKIIDFRVTTELPQELKTIFKKRKYTIEAFNHFFEYSIWNNLMAGKYGWPTIALDNFRCTQARALQFSLPTSLEDVGQALGMDIQKDKEGHKVMMQMCKPRKPSKKNPSVWWDDDERYTKLLAYCVQDVNTTYAIRKKLVALTKAKNSFVKRVSKFKSNELEVFKFNSRLNLRGVYCDKHLAKRALDIIKKHEEFLNEELKRITEGEVETAGQVAKIIEILHNLKVYIPNLQAKTVSEWVERDIPEKAKIILDIRKQLSKSSTKKIKTMLEKSSIDGRIRDILVYYGARRTGRFAGAGIQVQNFPKPSLDEGQIEDVISLLNNDVDYHDFHTKYPQVLEAISSVLRGMLRAPEGNKFYDSDFSSIEARVLFWLADEKDGLEVYREGRDIYKEMAGKIYNKSPIIITKDERQLGKQAVLGCGYSMSPKKFKETCNSYNMDVSEQMAKLAVKSYRETFSKVVNFWKEMNDASVEAVLKRGTIVSVRNIHFMRKHDWLFLCLPSGRCLTYHMPDIEVNNWGKPNITYMGWSSQVRKYERQRSYGGKLVENITQAVARDIMVEAMLKVEKSGYPVVFTVHDQVVSEVKDDYGTVEDYNKLMESMPIWAKDAPITAETDECRRFKK